MSWDISLVDPVTGEVLELDQPHLMRGGTYAIGGTTECSLNVTYNYSEWFKKAFGPQGIDTLDHQAACTTLEILEMALDFLMEESKASPANKDYWQSTAGNAARTVCQLLTLAHLRPDGIWRVI